ncbi:hypothetical protein RDABS01_034730 [Bienertia sinuspersici]
MDVDGRNSACFKGIHDKVMRCISSWKFSYLAITGRCILINSVLMALAAHIMAVYLLPKKILNKINSTILRFLWRGNKEGKPIYWRSQTLLEQKKHEGGMGLRNIDSLNQALLFRQVWRINKKPDSLVGRILTQKYGGNPLQAARWNRMPTNTSWAFKSMVKCARSMLPGCGKRIGNGQSTRIVEDTWAGNLPVKFKRNNPPSHDNAPKYVKELLRGRTWDTSKFWYYFNRSDAQRVLSTYIPQHEKEDETIWLPKEDGNYSVKSGYWFFHSQALKREQSNFWKILWKSQMSQRWKIFCWKMLSDKHKQLWPILVAILWAIWLHRNNVIFRNDNPNPQEVLNLTKLELGRWFRGFGESMEKRDKGNLVLNEKRKETNWSWGNAFQVDNILKIDGAWKKTKNGGIRAAYGWVMERGNRCIREEASRIFAASPLQAEAQAMLEGISSARMDWTTVEVWTDSERMIQMLHKPESAPTNCYFLILDILSVLKTFATCSIYKVCRSNVRRAHELATQARQGP